MLSPSFVCSVSCDTASLPVFRLPTRHKSNADNFDLSGCIKVCDGGGKLLASAGIIRRQRRESNSQAATTYEDTIVQMFMPRFFTLKISPSAQKSR